MDRAKIIERFGKYYKYLEKLNEYPYDQTPSITELGITQADKQASWRDIKELQESNEFNGTIVDYLCYITTMYALINAESKLSEYKQAINQIKGDFSKSFPNRHKSGKIAKGIDSEIMSSPFNKNIIRLYLKNPDYLLNNEIIKNLFENINDDNKYIMKFLISSLINISYYINSPPGGKKNIAIKLFNEYFFRTHGESPG